MTTIKETVTVLCVLAVGFGCIKLFIPRGGAEQTVHGLLCLVMLLLVITTLNHIKSIDFSVPELDNQSIKATVDVNNTILQQAENNTEQKIKTALQDENIHPQDVQVYMDISDNNSISITKVIITLYSQREAQNNTVKNHIYALTGLYPEIINKG